MGSILLNKITLKSDQSTKGYVLCGFFFILYTFHLNLIASFITLKKLEASESR